MGIEAILFDLGNVLVEFDNEPIAVALAQRATRTRYSDPREVGRYVFHREKGAENSFDTGRISPQDFFRELAREMGLGLAYADFVDIWNAIFRARAGSEALVRFLHGRMEMHLLSNTNVLHFEHLLRRFPWLGSMDSCFLSHEMGCRKPSPEIYERVLKRLELPPDRILYLDDIEANLIPAANLGMQTALVVRDTSVKDLVRAFLPHLPWEDFP
jgi:glucose-1-phosphatase